MHRRKLPKLGVAVVSATMLLSMAAPAMAATTYTAVEGTSCNFNKYLIMDEGDTVPNISFAFTVAPGTARSADTSDNTVMQVLPGVGTPTIANVVFAPSDTTVLEADVPASAIDVQRAASTRATGLTADDGVELEAGEKYAVKAGTVSFAGISFPEPGIYRYVITETADAAHEAAGIMHDNDTDRILDVYVTDDGTGTLVVSAYVLHTADDDVVINTTMGSADVAAAADALDDKTDGFTNELAGAKDLVFTKAVTGNQASRDKYFEFTATLGNVNDADVYVVSLADDSNAVTTDGNADATSGTTAATRASNQGQTNPASVTGAELKAGVKFYLQHGQSIAIRGIAPNATYAVTEDAEDYKSTSADVTGYTDATSGTIGTVAGTNKAVMTSYTNERSGIIPTGIAMAVGLGAVTAAFGGAGAAMVVFKKRERDDEE